jgi:hypothetical protein
MEEIFQENSKTPNPKERERRRKRERVREGVSSVGGENRNALRTGLTPAGLGSAMCERDSDRRLLAHILADLQTQTKESAVEEREKEEEKEEREGGRGGSGG